MIDQRDYMRNNPDREPAGCIFAPGAVFTLIFFSVAVFIAQALSPEIIFKLSLISPLVFEGEIHRLFTYMFLHGNFGHILFNMWGVYLFGSILEQRIGPTRFYILYFISAFSGALLWLLFNRYSPNPCIGASGAVFGVMIATALFYPDMRLMLLFPPIPMKLKTFAIAYALLEIYFEFSGGENNIAHIVHLGGFFGGYIYIKILYGDQVWGIFSIFRKKPKYKLYDKGENIFSGDYSVSQEELDRLLDKISNEGINSLTEEEMETLRRAREEMNRRG